MSDLVQIRGIALKRPVKEDGEYQNYRKRYVGLVPLEIAVAKPRPVEATHVIEYQDDLGWHPIGQGYMAWWIESDRLQGTFEYIQQSWRRHHPLLPLRLIKISDRSAAGRLALAQ